MFSFSPLFPYFPLFFYSDFHFLHDFPMFSFSPLFPYFPLFSVLIFTSILHAVHKSFFFSHILCLPCSQLSAFFTYFLNPYTYYFCCFYPSICQFFLYLLDLRALSKSNCKWWPDYERKAQMSEAFHRSFIQLGKNIRWSTGSIFVHHIVYLP